MKFDYDPPHVAAFFDDSGEREWTRFEDGPTPPQSADVHVEHLRRFIRPGDRVLDIGAGPGRFTIELARLGAQVVVGDLSPGQLDLNREKVTAAGLEQQVLERVVADITDLSRFRDGSFDAVICFGGPLSYVLEGAGEAVAELVRVTRPGGHVLVSVMSLVGAAVHFASGLLDLVRQDGVERNAEIIRTGVLPQAEGYGHLPMKLYRWSELEELLSPHGTLVASSAAGLLPALQPEEPELREFITYVELQLASDPAAVGCGQHMLAVLRT